MTELTNTETTVHVYEILKVIVPLLVVFLALVAGVIGWLIRVLTRALFERLKTLETAVKEEHTEVKKFERELLEMRAMLPEKYLLREDWIRFSAVIDAKLEALGVKVDQILSNSNGEHRERGA